MNIALWVVQALLSLVFLVTGATKLFVSRERLAPRMGWARDFSAASIRGLGALEILGALGLVLPGLVAVAPRLTPAAALGLALLMGGAATVHVRRGEPVTPPFLLAVLALFVVAGRLVAR